MEPGEEGLILDALKDIVTLIDEDCAYRWLHP